ncbi:MAG: hypothetical protein JRD89_21345, partial [Deltaproteobacteria bacterium]|nr:hypothetical protein [Deltaproteobacteria bacterium]
NPVTGKLRIPNLNIRFILGRGNFICPLKNVPCDHPSLPCTRPLDEGEKRYEVASECPYWIPRYPERMAKVIAYKLGKDYATYRTAGEPMAQFYSTQAKDCPYLRQYYEAYINSEVIVMNDKLWLIETLARRKPKWYSGVEILDEVDLLLDRLVRGFRLRYSDIKDMLDKGLERDWKWILSGKASESDVFDFIVSLMAKVESTKERLYYRLQRIYEDWSRLVYRAEANELYFFYKSPKEYLRQILSRSNDYILGMSATLHDLKVLTDYFGFDRDSFCIVYGRPTFPGKLYLIKSRRWWIRHDNWEKLRKDVLDETRRIIEEGAKHGFRSLVQAHAFKYVEGLGIPIDSANNDFFDLWIKGKLNAIASTRTKRGVDLRKELIPKKLLIIPKFPLPDKESLQIRCLFETLPERLARAVYYDMAKRDLIQQIGRVLRSDDDWAVVAILDKLALRVL